MERPWPGWKVAYRVWMAVIVVLIGLFPFIAWDYVCMLPVFILVFTAGSVLNIERSVGPRCRACAYPFNEGT